MKTFQVSDMTCSHCARAVTKAVKRIDPSAHVAVNLSTKRVEVDSAAADVPSIKYAITVAGYTAVEENVAGVPAQPARIASCCGCH